MRKVILALILCFASPAEAGKNVKPQPKKNKLKGKCFVTKRMQPCFYFMTFVYRR